MFVSLLTASANLLAAPDGVLIPLMFTSTFSGLAVPVPVPGPVAVKTVPTVLLDDPINVKSVELLPVLTILYFLPTIKPPAFTTLVASVSSNVSITPRWNSNTFLMLLPASVIDIV